MTNSRIMGALALSLAALGVVAEEMAAPDPVTSVFQQTSDVGSGSSYQGDLQNAEWWSAGVPQGIGWLAQLQLASNGKTSYVTNSAPLNLEHLTAVGKDFYLRSTNPLVFNSASNSVVAGATTSAAKLLCPILFNAPVTWSALGLVQLRGATAFADDLTVTGLLPINNDGGCGTATVGGALSGWPDANASSGGYIGLFAPSTSFAVTNVAGFTGDWLVKNGRVTVTPGDSFWNEERGDVAVELPTSGLILHMDASDETTFTFAAGNRIAQWRSKVGDHVAVPLREGQLPVWREHELGTLPVVDMAAGVDASGFPLQFATSVSGAKTVFMVVGTANGGGWLWGSDDSSSRTFHRGGGCVGSVITDNWATTSYGVKDSLAWRNGRAFNVYQSHPGGGYELLSFKRSSDAAFNPIAGFAFDYKSSATRLGYQQLAEFIAYDVQLDDAARQKVEKYLHEKWLKGKADFRQVTAIGRAYLDVRPPVEAGHVSHLAHFSGRSFLRKEGDGEVVLDRPRDVVYPVEIAAGTIGVDSHDCGPRLAGVTAGVASEGLILHLDASVAGSLTTDADGQFVTEWRDCRGGEFVNKLVPGVDGTIVAKAPTLRKAASKQLPMVDFGYLGSKRFMNLETRITTAGTVLMVLDTRFGGGHVLSDVSTTHQAGAGGTSFHRGSSSQAGTLFSTAYDIDAPWGNSSVKSRVLQNFAFVKTNRKPPAGRPEVVIFHGMANNKIGRIGQDRNMTERSGGIRVGELLVYDRQLTDDELAAAYKHLESKWIDYDAPELKTVVAKGSGALDAKVDFAVDTLGGSGTLAAKGGRITVNGLADFTGSLVSDGGSWDVRHDKGAVPTANPVTDGLLAQFDPSDAERMTLDGDIVRQMTAVNDPTLTAAPRNGATAFARLTAPLEELNGRTAVNCDSKNSDKGLDWSTVFTNAQTVVCVYGAQDGGGHVFGAPSANAQIQPFQRDIGSASKPIFVSVQDGLKNGDVYIDGVSVGYGTDGLKSGYQILSFVMPQEFSISMMGYRTSVTPAGGGQRYGEVLVWNRQLADEERKAAEAYLAYKWFGKVIHGYTAENVPNIPGQDTSAGSATYDVAAGETTSIGYLIGAGGIAKTGAGTLELKGSTTDLTGGIDVREGMVKYTVTNLDPDELPVTDGLVAQFDPSDETTLTVTDGKVTQWRAKATGEGIGPLTAYAIYSVRTATLMTDELNGRPVVDTGAYGSTGQGFVCRSGDGSSDALDISNKVQTVFMVLGSQNGGGFMLGALCGEFWHRGSAKCLLTDAMYNGSASGSGKISACCLDGVGIEPTAANVLSGGYQIVETHRGTAAWWSGFSFDRYSSRWNSYAFGDRSGGQRLGEILLYDRKLTDKEIVSVRRYLWNRWYGRAYAGAGVLDTMYPEQANAGAVRVAQGATLDLNGFTQNCTSLGGEGTVVGDLTLAGTLPCVPGETLTVDGIVTFGPSGRIELPADWNGETGAYRVIAATAVGGVENLPNWKTTVTFRGCPYRARISVSGGDVFVSVGGCGALLLVR